MHIMNYKYLGENYIVYGAPRHEYFYGPYESEWFHEFCSRDTALNLEILFKLRDKNIELDLNAL